MTNQAVDMAKVILHDLVAEHVSGDNVYKHTDYIGTETGLCRVDVEKHLYGGHYYIGPVIGAGGVRLKDRKYFHFKYSWYAEQYLAECLEA